jgi:hypothetical protein
MAITIRTVTEDGAPPATMGMGLLMVMITKTAKIKKCN